MGEATSSPEQPTSPYGTGDDMATKRLYVHDDRSMWAVVTETDDGRFLHKFGDGDERIFLYPPPHDWQLLARFEDA